MKLVKRVLGITFLLAAIVGCLIFHVSAAEIVASGYCGGEGDGTNLSWVLDNEGTLTITGIGKMMDMELRLENDQQVIQPWNGCWGSDIKKVVIGEGVTTIGKGAFANCWGLAEASIPESVTLIDEWAFLCCRFETFTIPSGVQVIAGNAFLRNELEHITVESNHLYYCEESGVLFNRDKTTIICCLKGRLPDSYVIPDSVTTIGDYAFYDTSLVHVNVPEGVVSIGAYVFSGCYYLQDITIPKSTLSIGDSVFEYCSNLKTISVDDENPAYCDDDGILFNKAKTILLCCPTAKELTEYTIPVTVTEIGASAFYSCDSLTTVIIPNGVTSIGNSAFDGCNNLINAEIPDSATFIGEYAFSGCAITALNIPGGVTAINNGTFSACRNLTNIIIPNSVTTIGNSAFGFCTGLTSVTIPSSVTTIGERAFDYCSALTAITIPDGVVAIGDEAFRCCSAVTSIYISASATSIGHLAFSRCSNLETISVATGNPAYCAEEGVLFNKEKTNLICYPFKKNQVAYTIPNTVKTIEVEAFFGCTLSEVSIPDSVTTIGDYAFYNCESLMSVDIGNSVISIGNYAFSYCESLTSAIIPNSVTTIGGNVFYDCESLTTVTIPDSVTSIGGWTFANCSSLTGVTIPDSMTAIGDYTFYYCTSLTSVTIPDNVVSVGRSAFYNCSDMTSVTIGNGVTSIGSYAFDDCSSLTSVHIADIAAWCKIKFGNAYANPLYYAKNLYLNENLLTDAVIPDGVTAVGDYVFYNCINLTGVAIPDSVTTIGNHAFYDCRKLNIAFFVGTEEDWNTMSIGNGNSYLSNAERVYISAISDMRTITVGEASNGTLALSRTKVPVGYTITVTVTPNVGYKADALYVNGVAQKDWSFVVPEAESITVTATFTAVRPNAEIVSGGSCGEQVFWTLTGEGELVIYGSGAMMNYVYNSNYPKPAPWRNQRDQITTITIEDGVTTIGNEAFYRCDSLTSVTIGNCVTTIENGAFERCTALTSVTMSNSVTTIGQEAFSDCTALTAITIPDGVVTIGDWAFTDCIALTSVTIPSSVTTIGERAFARCSALTAITIPDGVITIGEWAFSDCSSLTSVSIPNGVTTIGDRTFSDCSALTSVTIPDSVISIGYNAFYGTSLQEVYYLGSQARWGLISIESGNTPLTSATIHYNNNVSALSFCQSEYSGTVGEQILIAANLEAGDLSLVELEKTVKWSSSNEDVFSIDTAKSNFLSFGSVSAQPILTGRLKAPGTAVITLTVGGISKSCKVTAAAMGEMTLIMSDANEAYSITVGNRGYLYVDISNYDGTATAKWTTSNKEVAAFDMSGTASKDGIVALKTLGGTDADCSVNFYARSVGTATVTCTLSNGLTASRQITVLPAEQAENESVVEKNPYNVPHYSDPPDERVEKYLNQYQGEWYEAYINYLDSLKEAIAKKEKENLGNGLSISIEEQAKIMMETDKAAGTSYLTFAPDLSGRMIPDEWKIYAYQALCEMLTDCAGNKLDFSNIDLSDEFKASTGIVKEIASKMSNYTSRFNYGGVTVEVNCGRYFGVTFGTMTCSGKIKGITCDFQIVVCTDINTNRQIIADYLNELRDLSVKSFYNIYDALAKDFLGDTVVGFSEKYFKDKLSHSKIIKTMAKLEEHFSEMGLGCASTLLVSGSEYYSKVTALCDKVLNNKNYDITKDLNALANINIEDSTITDKVVDKCAKKLARATEKLEAALREYLASGTIKEWNDDAWDFVKNIFNCPVSVTVYNSTGEIVGYAGEDDMWHADDIRIEEKGEGKIVYTPAGQEYSFKVTGTGHGAVNCTVEQWKDGEPVGRSNYYDIPVDVGTELTTTLSANVADIITPVFTSEGVDFEADEYIPVTANGRVTVNAEASNQEHGRVMGNGLYTRGDTVVLCAIPEDGYRFCGWYTENDELVTVSASFSFAAREDVSYTAHFAEIIPSLENYMVEINESYADVYDVEITQDGEAFTLHLQLLDSSVDMTELKALFAEYTADGKMTETHVLEGKVGENGMEFAGIVAGDHCKLFLLDGNCVPIIEACISR